MSTKLGQETMAYDKVTVPRPLSVATPMTFKLPLTRQKRYNNFIIFFMLERQLILHTFGAGGDETNDVDISTLPPDVRCYVDLYLPPLCSRYADLALSPDKWFVQLLAKKDKTRSRAKSQCGADLVPFAELKRIVANNYKEMDDETKSFVEDVANRLCTCYSLWKTNDTREEEDKRSNPRPQAIDNGESQTSKEVVRGNIKGNTNTTSRSYNNSHEGVQPLITTPHAPSQVTTSLGRSINLGTTNNLNSSYQTAYDYYNIMATKAQADTNSYNINQHPPLQIEHPSSTLISSELQCCLPTYLAMPPDDTAPAPQSSHHEIKMAQLQKELVNAMADRFEAEVKISIVKAQIMAEEARQASILDLQQQAQNDRMRLNLHHFLSLRQGSERATRNTVNGLTTSLFTAIMPPPPFGKTRRNSQEESTAAAVAAGGWVCGENTCSTSVEDTTAAAGAVGGWVCGETNGNTSKVERGGLYYDADQDQNKRRRVSSFPTNQYVPPSFIERQRKRLSLAHVTTHPQSPTTVSMADRRRQMPSSTYQRGVQW